MQSALSLAKRGAIRKKVFEGLDIPAPGERWGRSKCKTCGSTSGWPLPCNYGSNICQGSDCYCCSEQHNQRRNFYSD